MRIYTRIAAQPLRLIGLQVGGLEIDHIRDNRLIAGSSQVFACHRVSNVCLGNTDCTSDYGRRNQFRRNPPLRRSDREEMPLAGHALELVSPALLELEP
jgi:hypothetical protein